MSDRAAIQQAVDALGAVVQSLQAMLPAAQPVPAPEPAPEPEYPLTILDVRFSVRHEKLSASINVLDLQKALANNNSGDEQWVGLVQYLQNVGFSRNSASELLYWLASVAVSTGIAMPPLPDRFGMQHITGAALECQLSTEVLMYGASSIHRTKFTDFLKAARNLERGQTMPEALFARYFSGGGELKPAAGFSCREFWESLRRFFSPKLFHQVQ